MSEALANHQPPGMDWRQKWESPVKIWRACDRERREKLTWAWTHGELGHLLTPSQQNADAKMTAWSLRVAKNIAKRYDDPTRLELGRTFVLDSSRRWGKSAVLIVRALKFGATQKNWRMIYMGPEYKELRKIFSVLMPLLTQDCPPGLLGDKQGPDWYKSEDTYIFAPTGTRLEILGLDKNPDGARGPAVDYAFGDEMAFFENLEYVVQSVVKPQLMGRDHARFELASTPPVSPAHYWSSELVPKAMREMAHDKRTIEEADQYTVEEIEEFIRDLGGRRSTAVRREFYCEHVTDETMAIVPEFRDVEHEIVKAWPVPKWRDCYESMDPGWKDHTAVLLGYVDFEAAKLIVEDEISAPRLNSEDIAAAIKVKEEQLWKGSMCKGINGRFRAQPYQRWSDRNLELIYQLSTVHGLQFYPTAKKDLDEHLNALRVAVAKKQIIIHPRCKRLIYDLKNGVWKNHTKKIFAHSSDLGHFDTVAALMYLWRNINLRRNPAPKEEEYVRSSQREGLSGHYEQAAQTTSKWSRRGSRYYVR
jgi:hypothetical protein